MAAAIDGLNVLQGDTTNRGTLEVATLTEVGARTDTARAVTPAGLDAINGRINALRPDNVLSESAPRNGPSWANTAVLSSGRISAVAIPVWEGMVITTIGFMSATQALVAGTNQWFCLIDSSRNILKNTNDDTSTAWNASSAKELNLTSTYTVPANTRFLYVGIMVAGGTVPSLAGYTALASVLKMTTRIRGDMSTGNTSVITVGNTAGTFTDATLVPYCWVK